MKPAARCASKDWEAAAPVDTCLPFTFSELAGRPQC